MDKKQLRLYAKKVEGASDFVRLVFCLIAVLGFLKLMNFFTNATMMLFALLCYAALVGVVYWWVRREWRVLLAPLPRAVKRKPSVPKEVP